jgi:hypothetical protein
MSLRCAAFVCAIGVVSTKAVRAADLIPLKIINSSQHVIDTVKVSPSAPPASWSPNLLNGRTLGPGESTTVGFQGTCGPNDIRLYAEKGVLYVDKELMFCSGPNDTTLLVLTVGERTLTKTRSAR